MKKKFSVLSFVIVVMALVVAVSGFKLAQQPIVKNDVSYAVLEQYYDDADDMNTTMANEPTEGTTASGSSSGGLGDLLGGLGGSGDFGGGLLDGFGGIGGIFGDGGDIIGSVIGGNGSNGGNTSNNGTLNTTIGDNYIYIDPVPAATQNQQSTSSSVNVSASAPSTNPVAETINPLATFNPYARPTGEIKPGDMGDNVKWIQWNLIYTGYGLQGKEITGVYDDETVEVMKKLQAEKGLTPDGIINDDDIAATELLYYEHVINVQTTAPQSTATGTTAVVVPGAVDDNDGGSDILVIIIAVVLIAIIWFIAFVVIAIIFIAKKSKAKKAPKAPAVQGAKVEAKTESEETKEIKESKETKNGDMSLSDLFEEANNKK